MHNWSSSRRFSLSWRVNFFGVLGNMINIYPSSVPINSTFPYFIWSKLFEISNYHQLCVPIFNFSPNETGGSAPAPNNWISLTPSLCHSFTPKLEHLTLHVFLFAPIFLRPSIFSVSIHFANLQLHWNSSPTSQTPWSHFPIHLPIGEWKLIVGKLCSVQFHIRYWPRFLA